MYSYKKFKSFSPESKSIFNILRLRGPITKGEMCTLTDLPLTTLNRFLSPLEKGGAVLDVGTCESTGGRKPTLYDINKDYCYAVGVEISRFGSSITVVDCKLNTIFWNNFRMTNQYTPEVTISTLSNLLNDFLNKNEYVRKKIIGIGVGAVGPLDKETGTLLNPKYFKTEGWQNVNLKSKIEEKTGIPVFIENGAVTALLAEKIYGAGMGFDNIAYFNIGRGLRTSSIANGTLVRGINDTEDAFAHMIVDVDGERCICGNYGCVETAASARAIFQRFVSERKKGRITSVQLCEKELTIPHICMAAENGDSLCKEIIEGAATMFGAGLANYINLLNPQVVILSGPIIVNSEIYFNVSKSVALKKKYMNETDDVSILRMGKFGDKAIALGAGGLVLEGFFENKMSFIK